MAFAAAGLNCVGVGPTKLYVYNTTDTITSSPTGQYAGFNTGNCPGMLVGDVIIIAHNTAALMAIIRITAIDAVSVSFTEITALA